MALLRFLLLFSLITAFAGAGIDPNGSAAADGGPHMDPNGGASADSGPIMDPNGGRFCYTGCIDPNG